MIDPETPVSSEGEARREEILRLALNVARKRRTHRRAVRSGVVSAVIGLAMVAFFHRSGDGPPRLAQQPAPPAPTIPQTQYADVKSEANLLDRVSITDDQLLQTLAANGHPAALVTIHNRQMLLLR